MGSSKRKAEGHDWLNRATATLAQPRQKAPINSRSSQQIADDVGGLDAGQLLIEPLMANGESLMVEAQEVQHGGVKVADVDRILDDVVGEIVGFAVDHTPFDAAAAHPDGEAARMMIAAVVLLGQAALRVDRAA